jgi:LacI family transcriptional regulator
MSSEIHPHGVTLRDIGRSLGISHVTVSLALRNAPQISATRREQIHEAARRMGYRPNPMAAALGQRRSSGKAQPVVAELCWLNHWEQPKELHHYREFQLYWKGARETAKWFGYDLEEFLCGPNFNLERLAKVLTARSVPGILIPPHRELPTGWDAFPWNQFAVVRFGHSIVRPPVSMVTADQASNCLLAFEKIRDRGHKRVGLVTSREVNTRHKAGFLMAQLGIRAEERVPLLMLEKGEAWPQEIKQLRQWLKSARPDAILTDVAPMREMLKACGRHVPEDIGLAALSVLDGNADAGINQNAEEIGKAAMEMLISLINHNHTGVPKICRQMLIAGHWVDGSTLPGLG